MAKRPIFMPLVQGPAFVRTQYIQFTWFAGMALKQKQRSIDELHRAAKRELNVERILEASSKSQESLGVDLSAFNLKFTTKKYQITLSVESAYQGSKVFERGGPYVDLYDMPSREAKLDNRLKSSGRLVGFRFFGVEWPLVPETAFYDYVYICTLQKNADLSKSVMNFDAFTDIEFNPEKSINCQAYSLALFVSLQKRGLLEEAISSQDPFLDLMKKAIRNTAHNDELLQPRLEH